MQQPVNPQVAEAMRQEAKKADFHKALLALHGDIETMKKDGANPFFNSKYVPLPKMLRVLKPTMQKHGFILSQPTEVTNSQTGIVNVVFSTIVHADTGMSDTAKLCLPTMEDMQKLGGAITYARRYTLSALLGLEEADDDGNTATGKTVKKSAKPKVKSKDNF